MSISVGGRSGARRRLGAGRRRHAVARSASRALRSGAAFTLIELIIVLLIISTFSVMVIPSMAQAMRGTDVDATAAKLRETLDFACASALARRRPVTARFELEDRRCRVMLRTAAFPWVENTTERPRASTLAAMSWPEEMQVDVEYADRRARPASAEPRREAGVETVSFRADGSAQDAVIVVADQAGRRRYVEVSGPTGEVRVEKRLTE